MAGLITVDELPDRIKAKVRETIAESKFAEVSYDAADGLLAQNDSYTVDALNAGWLIRQTFTVEQGDAFSEDTSAVSPPFSVGGHPEHGRSAKTPPWKGKLRLSTP